MSFGELEMQRATELSKPHYKSEGASRPETVKSTTRTKVAVKAVESETRPTETTATEVQADTPPCAVTICPEEVRTRAFLKWEAAGCPQGDGILFWLEAESELQESN